MNKSVFFFISGILIVLIIFFIKLELHFRDIFPSAVYNQSYVISNNPRLLYDLNPNSKISFEGINVKIPATTIEINKDGIRDNEYFFIKPPNTFRIAVVGDSIAFGWGVELKDTFAKVLEARLNHNSKIRYEVINFGIPGYNLLQEAALIKVKVLKYNPDLLILNSNPSDFYQTFNYCHPWFVDSFLAKKSYFYRYLIQSIYFYREKYQYKNYAQKRGIKDAIWAISEIADIANKKKIKVLIAFETRHRWMADLIKKCLENNFVILDYHNALYSSQKEVHVSKKDIHPNQLGHEIIAEQIHKALIENKLISSSGGQS